MNGVSKLYWRFFVSYFLIFLIPVTLLGAVALSQINNNYLSSQMALQQAGVEKDLELLDYQVNQWYGTTTSISGHEDFSPQNRMRGRFVLQDNMNYLSRLGHSNIFFSSLFVVFPKEQIYSVMGYFNYDLFFSTLFKAENHSPGELFGMVESGERHFFVDDINLTGLADKRYLVYIMPLTGINEDAGCVLYCIDYQRLGRIFSYYEQNVGIYTVISSGESVFYYDLPGEAEALEMALIPVGSGTVTFCGEEYYLISQLSYENGMKITRMIPKALSSMYAEKAVLSLFMVGMVVVLALGSLLTLLSARFSFLPISRLARMAERMTGIPDVEKNEILYAETVIRNLQRQYSSSVQADALRDLINCDGRDEAKLRETVARSPIPPDCDGYAVAVAHEAKRGLEKRLEAYAQRIDCVEMGGGGLVMILSLSTAQAASLYDNLRAAACAQDWQPGVALGVGQVCGAPADIPGCYRQAMSALGSMLSRPSVEQSDQVAVYEYESDLMASGRFPLNDIEAMQHAIVNRDAAKFSEISDNLLKYLSELTRSKLFGISLCYNIMSACISALGRLGPSSAPLCRSYEQELLQPGTRLYEGLVDITERLLADIRAFLMESPANTGRLPDELASIISFIHDNYSGTNLSVKLISMEFGISTSNLSHRFKKSMGVNISEYIDMLRLTQARELLVQTGMTIENVAEQCGFGSTISLIRKVKHYYGITPTEYRNQHREE